MDSGYYSACTALVARTQALDTIANNLANANTVGFRAQHNVFSSVLADTGAFADTPINQAINNYGILSGTTLDQSQGALQKTGNDLDLGIEGPGYFVVQTASGPLYTRNGAFQVSSRGQLVTSSGDAVMGDKGVLSILPGPVSISPDGTISSNGAVAGKLKVAEFPAGTQLRSVGNTYYSAPLNTAATGMTAQQINLDNIANNLANSSTAGFQSRRVQFSDLLYQSAIMPGAAATQQTTVASGLQIGLGTRPGNTEIVQTQGDLSSTGNPLDFAIQGMGFFQILLPNGQTGYTRTGAFQTDQQGNLVTANGNALQPAINIPTSATNVTIGSDGTVSVTLPGQTQAQQVGVIQLAMFANPGGLNSVGNNIYLPTTASGEPVVGSPGGSEGMGTIQQGMLEQSNVNVVDEFVNMILAQRSYESNSRVIKAADEMLQQLNQLAQ